MGNKGKLIISACLAASATYFIEMIDVFVLSRPPFADLKERIMLSIALLLIFLASGYIIALLEILARWLVVERFGVGIFFARLGRSVRDRGEGGVYFVSVFYAVVAFFVLFVPANFCLTHHLLLTRHNKMMISFSQTALSIGVLLLCVFIAGIVFIFFKNLAGRSALKMETYLPVRFILRWMGIPLIIFVGVALAVFLLNLWWLKIVLDLRWFGYIVVFFILQLVIYRLLASRSRAVHEGAGLRSRWLAGGLAVFVCVAVAAIGMINKSQNIKLIARGKTTAARRLIAFFYPLERSTRWAFFTEGKLVSGLKPEDIMKRVREINDYAWSVRSSIPQLKDVKDWNVIYITLESTRADHMSCYGYKEKTSPNMDKFASENVIFKRAYIQGGGTHCAIPSVMTGTYITDCSDKYPNKLALPEIFRDAGYETVTVFDEANFVVDVLRRGMKTFKESKIPGPELDKASTAPILNKLALDYLRSVKGKKFYMWLHYWEPHGQYVYHPEFPFGSEKKPIDRYDSEIAYLDHYVGAFLRGVRKMGLMDNTIIIITGDHGEEFFEHGDGWHGKQLYDESIRVPLIMHIPGVDHQMIEQPVGQFNMMPTILNILGFEKPAQLQAVSLVPLIYLGEEQKNIDPFFYIPLPYKDREKQGIISGNWKLIYDAVKDLFELYNLQEDPAEKHNLFDDKSEVARDMQMKLLAHMKLSGYGKLSEEFKRRPQEKIATLKEPRAVAIDRAGNVYLADFRNYEVKKFSPQLKLQAQWGEEGKKPGQFKDPSGIALDSRGNIYVADTFNHRIQKFNRKHKFLAQFKANFFAPSGLTLDEKGNIYVVDTGNSRVKKLSPAGKLVWQRGGKGSGPGQFKRPIDVALRGDGSILVTDSDNKRIQILDSEGAYKGSIPIEGWRKGTFNLPYIDTDGKGNIYVTDPLNNRALKLDPEGNLIGVLKPQKNGKGILKTPTGIALDKRRGIVYIVDTWNHRIRKYGLDEFRPL